ncbi:MAG: PASTA domain-containing protein [bacterium]
MLEKEARTLRHLMTERGYLAEPEVVEVFLDIVRALGASHAQGILHGDIKPEKIVRSRDGRYTLVDYGVSRLGTARYMSPERARREPTDARSDIYSLGVVLYEAATGHPPFEGMNYQVIQRHISATPRLPRSLRPGISAELQWVIRTAMAKDPADRYQTAKSMEEVLREIVAPPAVATTAASSAPVTARAAGGQVASAVRVPSGTMSGRRPPAGAAARSPSARTGAAGMVRRPAPANVGMPAAEGRETRYVRREAVPGPRSPVAPDVVVAQQARPVGRTTPRRLPLALFAGVVGLLAVATLLLATGRSHKVPDVLGLTEERAVELAGRAGLVVVSYGEARDDTLPAGRVVEQSPAVGVRAHKSDTVRVVLSTGRIRIPDVVNLSATEAVEMLTRLSLPILAVESVYSDLQEVGSVAEVQPESGSRVELGTSVRLKIASGRATCPRCRASRDRGARFCTSCGYRYEF